MYLDVIRWKAPGREYSELRQIVDTRKDFDPRAARLDYFADILLASGWSRSDAGWIAPEHIREGMERDVGRGAHYLHVAVAAQIQFDEIWLLASPKP